MPPHEYILHKHKIQNNNNNNYLSLYRVCYAMLFLRYLMSYFSLFSSKKKLCLHQTFMTENEIRYKQTFKMQVDLIEKYLVKN